MDSRIIDAIKYISLNLDVHLDLKTVARAACLSPFHFHRLFKQETNLTLKKFIEALKIEKALEMLSKPEVKIQEIAAYLGYNDHETFSRAFKRRYKINPDDLRRLMEQIRGDLKTKDSDFHIIVAFKDDSPEEITRNIMRFIRAQNLNEAEVKAYSIKQSKKQDSSPKGRHAKNHYDWQAYPEMEAEMKQILNSKIK